MLTFYVLVHCFYQSRVHIPDHNKLYRPLSSLIKIISSQNKIWKLRSYLGSQIGRHTCCISPCSKVSKTRFNALSFVFPSFEDYPNLCSTRDPIAGLVSPRARRDLAKFCHNTWERAHLGWRLGRYFQHYHANIITVWIRQYFAQKQRKKAKKFNLKLCYLSFLTKGLVSKHSVVAKKSFIWKDLLSNNRTCLAKDWGEANSL